MMAFKQSHRFQYYLLEVDQAVLVLFRDVVVSRGHVTPMFVRTSGTTVRHDCDQTTEQVEPTATSS